MKTNTKNTIKIYWQHIKRYKLSFSISILALILGTTVDAIIPIYFKKLFDALTSNLSQELILQSLLFTLTIIALLELAKWIFWRIHGFVTSYFQTKVMADLDNTSFAYLHQHSFSFFNDNFSGSLVKKVNYFSRAFEDIADTVNYNVITLIVSISIITAVLSLKNIMLGIGIVGWLLFYVLINVYVAKFKLKYDIAASAAKTVATGDLADTITNNVNVKLFNAYHDEVKAFAKLNDDVRRLRKFSWNMETVFESIQSFLMIVLEIGFFYVAIRLWERGLFTIGDFVLLQSYLMIVMMRIWNFGNVIRRIYQKLADAEEMAEILTLPHEIVDAKSAKELIVTDGIIEFDSVDFCYQRTRQVLNKLNLKIKANERVALIGPSGAGKTTIIKLLLRQYEITAGKIMIDGQKINKITQESLWQNISLVPQDPILFHRSLLENIRYGKPSASDEEVIEAARLANCHEFINELPDKYDTFVGERGVKLSGGERQRVAIARAILRNAPILVLDEATSSLDSLSENLIQEALEKLMQDKTVIVIAHRLSTIRKVDRIIFVDEGVIKEEGTHNELVKLKNGRYKQLWKMQAGGFIS